jgi:hypothetical protein
MLHNDVLDPNVSGAASSAGHGHDPLPAIREAIQEQWGNYKKNALATAQALVEVGKRLIEAKAIVGHGRFGDWVNENCPFSYRSGHTYMRLARLVDEQGLKVATIANLGLRAAEALEANRDGRELTGFKRVDVSPAWSPTKVPSMIVTKKLPGTEIDRRIKTRIHDEEVADKGRGEWPRPEQPGELLIVSWPGPPERRAFVWSMDKGVHFRWIWIESGFVWSSDESEGDDDHKQLELFAFAAEGDDEGEDISYCKVSPDRVTWDQVTTTYQADPDKDERKFELCVRDPLRTEILDLWWERESCGRVDPLAEVRSTAVGSLP